MSASALPYRRSQPSWSKATPEEVSEQIFKFARRGLSPSQIGVILRDSHGIPQVKSVTGNKILRILKTNGEWTAFMDEVVCGIVGRVGVGCHPMEDCIGETYRAGMK